MPRNANMFHRMNSNSRLESTFLFALVRFIVFYDMKKCVTAFQEVTDVSGYCSFWFASRRRMMKDGAGFYSCTLSSSCILMCRRIRISYLLSAIDDSQLFRV